MSSRPALKLHKLADLENDEKLSAIREATEIAAKYKTPGAIESANVDDMKQDLLVLSALNVNIAEIAGVVAGQVQNVEDVLKLDRARTHLEMKEIKDTVEESGQKVRVTEKDIESVARVRASDIYELLNDSRAASEYAKFAYYAITEFGRVLQAALNKQTYAENTNVKIS